MCAGRSFPPRTQARARGGLRDGGEGEGGRREWVGVEFFLLSPYDCKCLMLSTRKADYKNA